MATTLYLKTHGDTVNAVSLTDSDLSGHMIGVFTIHGRLALAANSSGPADPVYLCCDVCENSVIAGGRRLPVLRQVRVDANGDVVNDFSKIIWVSTTPTSKNINSLRLYLVNDEGRLVTVRHCNLSCTLLAFPKRGRSAE